MLMISQKSYSAFAWSLEKMNRSMYVGLGRASGSENWHTITSKSLIASQLVSQTDKFIYDPGSKVIASHHLLSNAYGEFRG